MNDSDIVHETPDAIERNDGIQETAREQESSDYMSLKDNMKEPADVNQALQPPETNEVSINQLNTKILPSIRFQS